MINLYIYVYIYTTSILYIIIQNKYNLVYNTIILYNCLKFLLIV